MPLWDKTVHRYRDESGRFVPKKRRLSSSDKKLLSSLDKTRRGAVSREVNKDLVQALRKTGRYTPDEIERHKDYKIVGKYIKLQFAKAPQVHHWSRNNEYVYLEKPRGKGYTKLSADSYDRSRRMNVYWGKIKAFKDTHNISTEEAKQLYRVARKMGIDDPVTRDKVSF